MREQTKKYHQLAKDVARYKELKAKLNPLNDLFVIMDNSDDWNEYNLLTIKLTPYFRSGLIKID